MQSRRNLGTPAVLFRLWWLFGGVKIQQTNSAVPCEVIRVREQAQTTMLFLHGGGYVCCSPQTQRPITITLTRLLAAQTYVPEYRLAPEHPFPAAVEDAIAVYELVSAEAAKSKTSFVLAGDSAGGGLVIALAIHARDAGLPMPSSILTFSPWVDLTSEREGEMQRRENLCDMFYAESFTAYSAAYLQGAEPRSPLASPLFADLSNLPPLLIEVSDTELLYDEAVQLAERWRQSGNVVELNVSPRLPHGWQMLTPFVPEAYESLARAAAFVRQQLPVARA